MTVKDLIKRIRASTHDTDALEYSDEQLFNYINNGIRFIRRTIMEIDPYLLGEKVAGEKATLNDDDVDSEPVDLSTIVIDDGFSNIISVFVDGVRLRPINPYEIHDVFKSGKPKYYYARGFKEICIWPVPTSSFNYQIVYVPDMVILKDDDELVPFTNDIIDFIVEYAVIRASLVNEFDVSQESQIMSSITMQVENLLRRINQQSITVDGYWDRATHRDYDYGWGRRV